MEFREFLFLFSQFVNLINIFMRIFDWLLKMFIILRVFVGISKEHVNFHSVNSCLVWIKYHPSSGDAERFHMTKLIKTVELVWLWLYCVLLFWDFKSLAIEDDKLLVNFRRKSVLPSLVLSWLKLGKLS